MTRAASAEYAVKVGHDDDDKGTPLVSSPPNPKPTVSISWPRVVLSISLALFLFWGLFRFLGDSSVQSLLSRDFAHSFLAPALLSSAFGIFTAAHRMRLALRLFGQEVPAIETARAVLSAWPISVLTPARAGDLLRATFLTHRVDIKTGLKAVLVEKFIDAMVLMAVGCLLGLTLGIYWFATIAFFVVIAGLFTLLLPSFSPARLPLPQRLASKLEELHEELLKLRAKPALLFSLAVWSCLAISNGVLLLYLLLHFAKFPLPVLEVAVRWPVSMLAGALPLTPAGMATRDATFLILLPPTLRDAAVLLATMLYSIVSGWIYALVGLPFFLRAQLPTSRK